MLLGTPRRTCTPKKASALPFIGSRHRRAKKAKSHPPKRCLERRKIRRTLVPALLGCSERVRLHIIRVQGSRYLACQLRPQRTWNCAGFQLRSGRCCTPALASCLLRRPITPRPFQSVICPRATPLLFLRIQPALYRQRQNSLCIFTAALISLWTEDGKNISSQV